MAKLTDTQLVVLSKAAAHDDGLAVVPAKMNKGAASKVGSSLVSRKLMRELRAKPGMPVWREDEDGRGISLMITRAGRDAIGIDDETEAAAAPAKQKKMAVAGKASAAKEPIASTASQPRDGSKQALVISMLSKKGGASIDALIDATGWLPHTTRAALTGLRRRGFEIERSRDDDAPSVYRIVGSAGA